MLQGMLEDLGCEVVGPCATVEEAVRTGHARKIDAAFVDLILHGERADPVGEALRERGIPFGFATGLSDNGPEDGWRNHPFILRKPYVKEEVGKLLAAMLSASNPGKPSQAAP
jgi:hypothetical protein